MKEKVSHGGPCGRFCNQDNECRTCDALIKHRNIYRGLSSKEKLDLYKKRTKEAFANS